MGAPLEVTFKEVQRLGDEPLRALVARLCRAELSDARLPLSAVRAGGHQDAGDAGIDVHIELGGNAAGLDFLPRCRVGLQVKARGLPASAVADEMLVRGVLKPAIRELLMRGGAYILVSSKDSCTPAMLDRRLAAMRSVAADAGLPAEAALDFIGADRLADWTNRHRGVALWLHEQLDGPCHGWRGHGTWAAGAADVQFLTDEHVRVRGPAGQLLTALEALADMRAALRRPRRAVRLVGLSGAGKTRLTQALFEEGLGGEPLPAHLAVYCDVGEAGLQPPATEMLRRLTAVGRPQILVVDNCNPAAHRALCSALADRPGHVSLLTVEYDIQAGDAEETDVYQLDGVSPRLLLAWVARCWPALSLRVQEHIVELSEGNLRIAGAFASAVQRGGDLRGLPSADLYRRLFWQRGAYDRELEHVARVLALVYSFDAAPPDDARVDSEFGRLAQLADISPPRLHAHVGTLIARGLVQCRGRWRAVLPQGLAHKLASDGLAAVDEVQVWRQLGGDPRLGRSLARRLSSLHDSVPAQRLVERWFIERPGVTLFKDFAFGGGSLFSYLAPVRPDLALERLEALTAIPGEGLLRWDHRIHHEVAFRIAVHLAYPADTFLRAAEVAFRLAQTSCKGSYCRAADEETLCALFRPAKSGTHAPLEIRFTFLAALLDGDAERQRLGMLALAEALSTERHGCPPWPFGARARDQGWQPIDEEARQAWQASVLAFVDERVARRPAHAVELMEIVRRTRLGLNHVPQTWERFAAFLDLPEEEWPTAPLEHDQQREQRFE
ncbi:hypothetical protein ASC95_29150 [Pelomonas sp. Root1217]|uniref:hypothetical protein n=1 Tax=Pelomonas sp. Root1217 TaxID=1736430 RepID=UPI00070B7D32|nr:hypothetical protein [Pelomonas sp. Root1217]KQV55471.1 hypothetical protein ASC95_29150 [Pelomonas sp. Root1217]